MEKRTLFTWALQLRGQDQSAFAAEHGISERMLHYVLTGERTSRRIERAIDDLIAETLPSMLRLVRSARRHYNLAA